MEAIRQLEKRYCSQAMLFALVVSLVLIVAGLRPIGKGFLLGTLFSIVNFILMGETLPWRIGHTRRKTNFLIFGSMGARFALMALPLVAAIRLEAFDLLAVVAGLFAVQAVVLAEHVLAHLGLTRARAGKRLTHRQ
jgi:hypothetical protein